MLTFPQYSCPAQINPYSYSVTSFDASEKEKICRSKHIVGEKVIIGLLNAQQAKKLTLRSVFQETFSIIGIIKRPTEMSDCHFAIA
jgi:hypothetical protein